MTIKLHFPIVLFISLLSIIGTGFLYSSPLNEQTIRTATGKFIDQHNRSRYFRGINLSGSSKLPFTTHCKDQEKLCTQVSFTGRPFPLSQADRHFKRLQQWGFNFIRLIVTWEALEHDGPGIYDTEYITYVKNIITKAGEYGFVVLIDPHQDVWSRFTGGDGAPLWTLEKTGFDVKNFNATNAALVYTDANKKIPPMIWPTNYTKLASATMFTVFFAGNDFAPKSKIDGINIQDYLQNHYLSAYANLAKELQSLTNIIGFEVMNEPHPGWIGQHSISEYSNFPLRNKATPTPAEAIALGAGFPVKVSNWKVGLLGLEHDGKVLINQQGVKAWQDAEKDVWLVHGLWEKFDGKFRIIKDNYFQQINERKVNFSQDYYVPFIKKFAKAIRTNIPDALIFIEKPFNYSMPKINDLENLVNATHWYDQITLIKKMYLSWVTLDLSTGSPVLGEQDINQFFKQSVKYVAQLNQYLGKDSATLIGETGIPFDLSNAASYQTNLFGNWDFAEQNLALDRTLSSMEANQLSYALWNYTPDNTNSLGDQWNGEDLSIYSNDQTVKNTANSVDNGGRALRAVIRPFVSAVVGNLVENSFDIQTGRYQLTISKSDSILTQKKLPTIIYLPPFYYQDGFDTELSDGQLVATDNTMIWHYFYPDNRSKHQVIITPKKSLSAIFIINWQRILAIVVLLGILFLIVLKIKQRIKTAEVA